MVQLKQEGWIHHLARHAVGCFLTRGDLWISWEEGMKVRMCIIVEIIMVHSLMMMMTRNHVFCPEPLGRILLIQKSST